MPLNSVGSEQDLISRHSVHYPLNCNGLPYPTDKESTGSWFSPSQPCSYDEDEDEYNDFRWSYLSPPIPPVRYDQSYSGSELWSSERSHKRYYHPKTPSYPQHHTSFTTLNKGLKRIANSFHPQNLIHWLRPGSEDINIALSPTVVLPLKAVNRIFTMLDVESAFRFSCTSKLARQTITNIPEYSELIRHILRPLEGLKWRGAISLHSIRQLSATLHSDKCAYCKEFGAFISIVTAERCCLLCVHERPSLQLLSLTDAEKFFGLSKEQFHSLPSINVPFGWGPSRLIPTVSARMAKQLAISLYPNGVPTSYTANPFLENNNIYSIPDGYYWKTYIQDSSSDQVTAEDPLLSPCPMFVPSSMFCDFSYLHFPSLQSDQTVENGLWCKGCKDMRDSFFLNRSTYRRALSPFVLPDYEEFRFFRSIAGRARSRAGFLDHMKNHENMVTMLRRLAENVRRSGKFGDCLRTLDFKGMNSRYESLYLQMKHKGSCEWVLTHEVLLQWAGRDRSLLWIKGKPGSGKSMLLYYLIEEAPALEDPETIRLHFFFNDRGHDLEKSHIGFFRSVLHQLLCYDPGQRPELIDSFQEKLDIIGKPKEDWDWELWELRAFFKLSLARILKEAPIVLFIDALDECDKRQAEDLLEDIDDLFSNIPPSPFHFNVVIACREQPTWSLEDELTIKMHAENEKDIEDFVRAEFFEEDMPSKSETMQMIIERANGSFLWARLICDAAIELEIEGASPALIKEKILRTPQEMSDMYRKIIDGIDDEERLSAMWVMIEWILFAVRPLSPNELRWAMAVDAESPHKSLKKCASAIDFIVDDFIEWNITTLGRGLVEIARPTESKGPIVQFIHETAKQFFANELSVKYGAIPGRVEGAAVAKSHFRLAQSCIRYLRMKEISQSKTLAKEELETKFPLLRYAVSSWPIHVRQGIPAGTGKEDLLRLLGWPSESFLLLWLELNKKLGCHPSMDRIQQFTTAWDLDDVLSRVLEDTNNRDADSNGFSLPGMWVE